MTPKVDKVGKAFIVDPNPPGMEVVPTEDLFIYVKFSAYPRSRVTYGGQSLEGNTITFNNGIEDEVHFISTKIKYDNSTGKLDPPLQKTYATTDWTNIGGFNSSDTKSAGVLEGFGIKSIDIKYNSSLVPTVDITFTDVRGGALFDVIKDNDRLSPYSIFFKMPYPVFNLSIKGYFGQKVDFCLHMVNWTSNFDGATGNFDISANFLGFQQAFLNDMVLGNIIGAVNTVEGYEILNQIYETSNSDIGLPNTGGKTLDELRKTGELNIRKIDDFFTQISKLQVESEIIKTDSNSFQVLKDLNGKLSLLKTIRSFIGGPIQKELPTFAESVTADQRKEEIALGYNDLPNKPTVIQTSSIKDDELTINKNYISIRDYIVFNSINRSSFKSFVTTLNSIILKYSEYITSDKRVKPQNTLDEAKDKNIKKTQKTNFNDTKTPLDEELISSFGNLSDDENWENFIVSPTKNLNNKPDPKRLDNVLENFILSGSSINLKKTYLNGPEVNTGFNMELFKKRVTERNFYSPKTSMLEATNVLVADFRKQRVLVENNILILEEIIKIQKEIVQEEINKKINENFKKEFNFNPTIGKCFEIIANNTQAMVQTVYRITSNAEDISKSTNRTAILKGYETDVPTGIDGVGWPSIYEKNDKGDISEIYIGEVAGINSSDFPEWDFVERVFENLIGKTKTLEDVTKASVLKNGLDTDNWFPINPIDYKINPWIRLNSINDINAMGNELIKQFFNRVALLNNYTLYSPSNGLKSIDQYAKLESIAANKTVFSQKARNIISNILLDIESQLNNPNSPVLTDGKFNLKNSNYYKNFILDSDVDYYEISEVNEFQKIGDFKISGKFSDEVDYVLFDESSIINNSKKLFQEIIEDEVYRNFTDKNNTLISKEIKGSKLFYKNFVDKSNNFTTYNTFNVWINSVSNEILKSSSNNILGDLSKCKISDINPSGVTYNSKYLNLTYFNSNNVSPKELYEDILIQSEFYKKQTSNYSRALLLLTTFPFRNFKEGFLDSVFDNKNFNGARIITLPKFYVYYIGSLLWRYEESNNGVDPLKFNITSPSGSTYSIFQSPSNSYLNKIGFRLSQTTLKIDKIPTEPLENELIKLPKSVKDKFINMFKNWVDNQNFNNTFNGSFERNMTLSIPDLKTSTSITNQEKNVATNYIFEKIKETTTMILLNPSVFDNVRITAYSLNKGLIVTKNSLLSYVTEFKQKFNEVEKNNNNGGEQNNEKVSDNKSTNTIKLQLYNYFKNINNKWVGDTENSFNVCGDSGDRNLIEYFKFIDRGWRFIGDEATFNLKSFLTLGSNLNTSVYFFMSKLLRDSNFLLQILPTYINFKNAGEVAKIFQPQTTLQNNDSSGPIYCCIYVGGASQALDIGERSNYYFKDDGFSLTTNEIPSDLVDENGNINGDESSLVAFRVSFGAQNQTVFKNVSLSQQEHRETGEYFKALSDLVDKRGGTQKTYVGTDLLRLFKTRSYSCKVEAMGCMNIQPLMYFDLQNVPFFNGAYLITSVSHSISPNQMSTNFEGVRQSKYITSPSKQITADLDIDLNESSETPKIEFTNLNNKNPIYSIGVLNPSDNFNFTANFTVDKFKLLGVTNFTDEDLGKFLNSFRVSLLTANLKTNSQVSMFISSVLTNSNNLLNTQMSWDIENKETYENKFPNTDLLNPGKTIYYGDTITSNTYLYSLPVFSAGSIADISYNIPGNDKLKEFTINNNIENRKLEIDKKISSLNVNVPSEKLEIDKLKKEKNKLIEQEENLTGTTKYYNIFEGDAYRFRPRGYLYVIGRKQYTDLFGEVGQSTPWAISLDFGTAMFASIKVWQYLKDNTGKTAYQYSSTGNGSATIFSKCVEISQQYPNYKLEESFSTFEKVLNIFVDNNNQPLINYFNPGP